MSAEERSLIENGNTAVNALLAAAIGEEWRKRATMREAMDRAISAQASGRRHARTAKRRARAQR